MTLAETVRGLLRTAEGAFTGPVTLVGPIGSCVAGHHWLTFEGGSACARCEAWVSNPRTEHTVELHPASQMDLTGAVAQLRASLVAEPVLPDTVAVQLPTLTSPVPVNLPLTGTDRQIAIVDLLLPVVRADVSLSTLLVMAARVEALL